MAGENAERAGPLRPLSHPILSAFVPKFIVSQKLCQPDWGKTWEIFSHPLHGPFKRGNMLAE